MNANRKNGGLNGSRTAGLVSILTVTLRQIFARSVEAETISLEPLPDYPVGLWENADMWQRRSIR